MIKPYIFMSANCNAQCYNSSTSFVTFFEKGWGDWMWIYFQFLYFQKNQPKPKLVCESFPPPHFHISYMHLYKEYYVEWGSWYKQGTMLQRQKQLKMWVVVNIIFVRISTESLKSKFRQLIKHICIKIDNLYKQYFKYTQGRVFLL